MTIDTPETPTPDVTIAIPTCNGRHHLETCFASLAALRYPADRVEIAVYDNGSTDGTAAWLATSHPDVRVLSSATNEGFATPCNRLVEAARSRLVLVLNNDVRVAPDLLDELVAAASATGAACVGARVLSSDGERIEFDGGTMSFVGHGAPLRNGERASEYPAPAHAVDTLFASGAAMLVDRDAFLAAGGFDGDYFAYFEDVDLGWRLWTLGERCVQASRACVRHREHGSEAILPVARRLALLERNALLSVIKNYEEARAGRVFRCALALLAERASLAADPIRRRACRDGLLAATRAFPVTERKAEVVRQSRRRQDADIAALFVDPWRVPIPGVEYARRHVDVAELFGAADLFGPPPDPTRLLEESACA